MVGRRDFLAGIAASVTLAPAAGAQADRDGWPRRPVEIVDDVHGVPHIRAQGIADAFFGQGYVVARDRLFQIDLAHRRAMGRMAEVHGEAFVAHDIAARLFHYRGDIAAEEARVPAQVRECARAWVAGVNARIDAIAAGTAPAPPEYAILGVAPLRWDVRDLLVARSGATGNVEDGIRRAQLAALGLLHLDELMAPLRPATTLAVPAGLDVAAVGDADLGVLLAGALPFGPDTPARDPDARADAANAGSNAWTVAPDRTATGRAILANDPHLGIGGFGARHVAHLSAPGLDVIGAGAPGLPGIMQGHTDRFAFGRTNFHIDQEDVFVLDLHPDDPELYRHAGGWKRFVQVEEEVAVRGAPPRRVTLRHAVHGPVLRHDPARRRATAMASVAMRPGGSGAFAMIAINLARDWRSLQAAFRLHPLPTNFHYADVDGHHAWQAIGFVPRRRAGDGLLPAPGGGSYDWTGVDDHRVLPGAYDPPAGWFASANQNNLPAGWPRDRIPAHSFREPFRYARIAAVLDAQPRHSIADSVALQHDTVSLPARRAQTLIGDRRGPAAAMLRDWDARIDPGSAAAALFEIWWRMLGERLLAVLVPERARHLVTDIAASALLDKLAAPGDPHAALIDAALADVWERAHALLGPDPARWRWDALHQVRLWHPLARVPAIAAAFPGVGGAGSGGDDHTVMARWLPQGDGWRTVGGAAYLQVIDVGAWDASLMLNLPGQSGDPRSPHYRDHYDDWIAGRMRPLLFSRAAVDAQAAQRTVLMNEADRRATK